jgi:RNA polymerase sigma-70 factor (ECF subfamily)
MFFHHTAALEPQHQDSKKSGRRTGRNKVGAGMDEGKLIQMAKKGDLEAFNQLVLKYQDMAYNVAYRILGDHAAAEDMVQDGMIAAYRHLKQFRGGSFRSWLLRIVTNACYDELRRWKRRPTTSLEPVNQYDEEIESPAWLEDPGETPEDFALRSDLNRAIQACLDDLNEEFRTVVVLVDIQGMSYLEAAEIIGTPLGTVKSRLVRARKQMQSALQDYQDILPAAFCQTEDIVDPGNTGPVARRTVSHPSLSAPFAR